MSTKHIREALGLVRQDKYETATATAQVELENLQRACRTVVANGYTADMRAKGLDTSAAILEAAAREAP